MTDTAPAEAVAQPLPAAPEPTLRDLLPYVLPEGKMYVEVAVQMWRVAVLMEQNAAQRERIAVLEALTADSPAEGDSDPKQNGKRPEAQAVKS